MSLISKRIVRIDSSSEKCSVGRQCDYMFTNFRFHNIQQRMFKEKPIVRQDAELKILVKQWDEAIAKVQKAEKPPVLIYEENSRAVAMLRDFFNPSYEAIYVNDEKVDLIYKKIKYLDNKDLDFLIRIIEVMTKEFVKKK